WPTTFLSSGRGRAARPVRREASSGTRVLLDGRQRRALRRQLLGHGLADLLAGVLEKLLDLLFELRRLLSGGLGRRRLAAARREERLGHDQGRDLAVEIADDHPVFLVEQLVEELSAQGLQVAVLHGL